jgi:hypothetical protein
LFGAQVLRAKTARKRLSRPFGSLVEAWFGAHPDFSDSL